jgi:hypothetical protein
VLVGPHAAAVLQQPSHPYDPATELLFRDFSEFLVRLAAMRYPQLPRLELQVQQVLAQHLLPLLGGGAGRQGGFKPQLQARTSITRSDITPASAAAGACSSMMAASGHEQVQEGVVLYLQSQAMLLQQLFSALCCAGGRQQQQQLEQQTCRTPVDAVAGKQQEDQANADAAWLQQTVTVRQVAAALGQVGWLQQWQLGLAYVSGMLLEGVLQVADPEGLRWEP